ncbi:2-phospho-L-lactate transferase [Halolamina pelagica]|uniref:2-phospho-L-lactate transferase n=1 Tax=Halolamina pelagica TaxID=699431 RepID=A0A0P7HED4_9EURY|nr:2-phospho-L-lactate transferase [Halolamina pelagica]
MAEFALAAHEGGDAVRREIVLPKHVGDGGLLDDAPDLVVVAAGVAHDHLLGLVAVGPVANVVQQRRRADVRGALAVDAQVRQRFAGQVVHPRECSKRVWEAEGYTSRIVESCLMCRSRWTAGVSSRSAATGERVIQSWTESLIAFIRAPRGRAPKSPRCVVGRGTFNPTRPKSRAWSRFSLGDRHPQTAIGEDPVFARDAVTVVGNTGDDVELGGLLVSPDIDTVLFDGGGVLDRETWWGIEGDTHETDDELFRIADAAGLETGPRYLDDDAQTAGREIARWRRFSGVAEFMTIGDRDRAVHVTRTSLLDEGHTLTAATRTLAEAFDLEIELLPMSDDPVATMIHTPGGEMHFQEYWVAERADPPVEDVEFRGADRAEPTPEVESALADPWSSAPRTPSPRWGRSGRCRASTARSTAPRSSPSRRSVRTSRSRAPSRT